MLKEGKGTTLGQLQDADKLRTYWGRCHRPAAHQAACPQPQPGVCTAGICWVRPVALAGFQEDTLQGLLHLIDLSHRPGETGQAAGQVQVRGRSVGLWGEGWGSAPPFGIAAGIVVSACVVAEQSRASGHHANLAAWGMHASGASHDPCCQALRCWQLQLVPSGQLLDRHPCQNRHMVHAKKLAGKKELQPPTDQRSAASISDGACTISRHGTAGGAAGSHPPSGLAEL